MNELKVNRVEAPVIDFNFEEMSHELIASMEKYKNLVVTEENYKDCKVIRKDLTKMKKQIDDFRKQKKNEMSAPIKIFESRCKTLCALIEDVEKPIKEATDKFDDEVREQKKTFARCAIEVAIEKYGLIYPFKGELVLKDEYSNLSTTKKKVEEDIEQKAQYLKIQQDQYLERCRVVEEKIKEENKTLTNGLILEDFSDLILEATDSSTVLKKVTETALKKREEEQRVKEELKKEIEAPVIMPMEDFEPVVDDLKEVIEDLPTDNIIIATIEASGTEKKMDALVAFMKATGIDYEIKDWGSF